MLLTVSVAVPSLYIVVVRSLVLPTVTVPNPILDIGVRISGSGGTSPVPETLNGTFASSGSFELTLNVAFFSPPDEGANRTVTVREPEAGTVNGVDGPI